MMDFIGQIFSSPILCLGWIIVGFIAGAGARRIMGSKNAGCLSDIILGLIGSFVGGVLASWLGLNKPGAGLELAFVNILIAIGGACVLIALGRIINPRRR
jgi:uncharacterized membrane protein YeaQ/YmgE (transglycosylase-associated protein family)